MPIDALKNHEIKTKKLELNKKVQAQDLNNTLKGVLLNNHIKQQNGNEISFDEIRDSLLINNSDNYYSVKEEFDNTKESSFDTKKALKPLLIGTGVAIGGIFAMSSILKHGAAYITKKPAFEQLPDLAINMNIREETEFALYRAIRDPNKLNILGAAGVFAMSGITLAFKNFVDGTKEIWLKKQSADIEKNLQENLISVEARSFSGKLKVINDIMDSRLKYFDCVINNRKNCQKPKNIFSPFVSFKGNSTGFENKNNKQNKEDNYLKKNWKYLALTAGVLAGAIIAGKFSISNFKKTAEITKDFNNKILKATTEEINNLSNNKSNLNRITELLKAVNSTPEYVTSVGKSLGLSEEELKTLVDTIEKSHKEIFADAPQALGGITRKIQYYCYIDEPRGHLYNWILNPKNKFTKYIFLAFTGSSVGGYLFKEIMDASKSAIVMKENAKTDLDLRKRLVDVEIANFRAKKESAVQPLTDKFALQANSGTKSKEELKQLADNILVEIKNGPPYVYA